MKDGPNFYITVCIFKYGCNFFIGETEGQLFASVHLCQMVDKIDPEREEKLLKKTLQCNNKERELGLNWAVCKFIQHFSFCMEHVLKFFLMLIGKLF